MTNVVKKRDSNLELYRILVMLLIVVHHYVVNSGLIETIFSHSLQLKDYFLLSVGAFGKTGINCFVLITGYFMCQSNITLKKYLKLIFEVLFYQVIIYLVFCIFNISQFSIADFIKTFLPLTEIRNNFTGCFLIFYLFIPFLNKLIHNLDQKLHLYLVLLCVFTYTILGTLNFEISMNYVTWFTVLYFIASYIRIYPNKIIESKRIWIYSTILLMIGSLFSVYACCYIREVIGIKVHYYYFLEDSYKFLALGLAISTFLLFKNLNIKYNKIINSISITTFGILLIHANSDLMRNWLWVDTLKNVIVYNTPYIYLHALLCPLLVFFICFVIDTLRIKFIEVPVMKAFDKYFDKLSH